MPYGIDTDAMAEQIISTASNLAAGVNATVFTATDLATFYPQFISTKIQTVAINTGGHGYAVDDVLAIIQSGASGGSVQVLSVATVGIVSGIVTGVVLRAAGADYATFNALPTTVIPSGGTGCTINVVATQMGISTDLMDLFIEMASSSLIESRWKTKWKFAMSLYVAHFLTLWLRTQSGPNTTAAQVVATAQALLVTSSKSVGGVSVSYDTSTINGSLPGWGDWLTTSYGTQLAQLAAYLPSARAGMYVR